MQDDNDVGFVNDGGGPYDSGSSGDGDHSSEYSSEYGSGFDDDEMEDVERGSTDGEVSDYLATSDDEDGTAGRRAGRGRVTGERGGGQRVEFCSPR